VRSFFGRHAIFAFVFVPAAGLMLHFAWHHGLASLGDDSVGYLTLAQWIAGSASPFVREWVPYHTNFPPLFPLVLAATGGATPDFLAGHMVVALCAIASLVPLYRFAALLLGDERVAAGVVLLFLLLPTAWIGLLPLQSETLYLLISLGILAWHGSRMSAGQATTRDEWILGMLLGLAIVTRVAALALVAAYVVHAACALRRRQTTPARCVRPVLPAAALAFLWLVSWPAFRGRNYGLGLEAIARLASGDPAGLVVAGYRSLADGWVASFAMQPDVHVTTRCVILAVGVLALAGAVLRARRNALDGWYVLAALAMIFLWYQPVNVTRRLLYPLVPVMLVHAALFVRFACARLPSPLSRRVPAAAAIALPLLFALPPLIVVQLRAFDRAPLVRGEPESFSQFTEAYTTLSEPAARALVAREIAVVQGLRALAQETPPGARILWMRPDYVALLGHRQGVPWLYREGLAGLAARARRERADYVIVSSISKADIEGGLAPRFDTFSALSAFAAPVAVKANAVLGDVEFALMRIDPAALEAYLARDASPPAKP